MIEQVLDRQQKHRLAVLRHAEEVTGNVAATCRYYGIARQTFYLWQRRFDAEGVEGLKDRSQRPKTSPNATHAEVVGKIIYLRQNYHFGPEKIAMYLKRYHQVTISNSGVWRILKRLDMNRLPASQKHKAHDRRWKRYEKQLPGHRVQIDVKFIEPLPGATRGKRHTKFYQFTAIDDCTRLRVLRIYPRLNQDTAIQFTDYVMQRLPFALEVIQTDNGSEFGTKFHWHILDQGIGHVYIKPRTPRLNGKVERSHRIDAEEFYRLLDGVVIDDAKVFNDKLQEWEDYYNYHRPHGALGGQTPYERLRQKTRPERQQPPSGAHRAWARPRENFLYSVKAGRKRPAWGSVPRSSSGCGALRAPVPAPPERRTPNTTTTDRQRMKEVSSTRHRPVYPAAGQFPLSGRPPRAVIVRPPLHASRALRCAPCRCAISSADP